MSVTHHMPKPFTTCFVTPESVSFHPVQSEIYLRMITAMGTCFMGTTTCLQKMYPGWPRQCKFCPSAFVELSLFHILCLLSCTHTIHGQGRHPLEKHLLPQYAAGSSRLENYQNLRLINLLHFFLDFSCDLV